MIIEALGKQVKKVGPIYVFNNCALCYRCRGRYGERKRWGLHANKAGLINERLKNRSR